MVIEGKTWDEVDWRRNLVFICFGGSFLGAVLYLVYVPGFRRVFKVSEEFGRLSLRKKLRDRAGMINLTKQVFADVFVIGPFLYWPVFYAMKALCFRESSDPRSGYELCRDALLGYRHTFVADNFGMAAFWIPANYMVYAIPLHLRMPVNHCVSLLWTVILSLWRGQNPSADDA